MRKLSLTMDERGSTKVEILPDPTTKKFFTKRDFDRALRAIKKAYRQSIKEYRKQLSQQTLKERKNANIQQLSGEKQDEQRTEKREEPGADSNGAKKPSIAGAAEQALKRSRSFRISKGG